MRLVALHTSSRLCVKNKIEETNSTQPDAAVLSLSLKVTLLRKVHPPVIFKQQTTLGGEIRLHAPLPGKHERTGCSQSAATTASCRIRELDE